METRAVTLATPLLLLIVFGVLSTPSYAQNSLALPQDVAQIIVADSALKKEIPIDETVTEKVVPIYIPDFPIEEEKGKVTKREWLKRFFTLRWGGLLDWFWTEPEIDEKSESAELLQEWEDMLGVDIFYAYFKAQEARRKIKDKFSFRVCGMRASADYRDGKIYLVLKRKF